MHRTGTRLQIENSFFNFAILPNNNNTKTKHTRTDSKALGTWFGLFWLLCLSNWNHWERRKQLLKSFSRIIIIIEFYNIYRKIDGKTVNVWFVCYAYINTKIQKNWKGSIERKPYDINNPSFPSLVKFALCKWNDDVQLMIALSRTLLYEQFNVLSTPLK